MRKFLLLIVAMSFFVPVFSQPAISVNQDSVYQLITNCNDTGIVTVTITNSGASALDYSIPYLLSSTGVGLDYLYAPSSDGNVHFVIDQNAKEVMYGPTATGSFPWRVEVSPDGQYAYMSCRWNNYVSVVETATNNTVTNISTGSDPAGIAFTPDGQYALVAVKNSAQVSVINCTTQTIVSQITNGVSGPEDVAITPDGKYAYVANRSISTVTKYDIPTWTLAGTIPSVSSPHSICIAPSGDRMYVSEGNWTASVKVFDLSTDTLITTIFLGNNCHELEVTPDGKWLYVASGDQYVYVVNTETYALEASIYDPVFSMVWGIAISQDGKYVYTGNGYYVNTVSVIETATNSVIKTIQTDYSPRGNDIGKTPRWISMESGASGSIAAGASLDIDIQLFAQYANSGIQSYDIYLFSNDNTSSPIRIPVYLELQGVPEIAFSEPCHDFGQVLGGGMQLDNLPVINDGCDTLKISDISATNPVFVPQITSINVPPYSSDVIPVAFSPSIVGMYNEEILFVTNIGDTSLCVAGECLPPPVIDYTPSSFNVVFNTCDEVVYDEIIIGNSGASNLDYQVTTKVDYDSVSSITMWSTGVTTVHVFNNLPVLIDTLFVTVTIQGDYNSSSEYAELYIDGTYIAQLDGGYTSIDIPYDFVFSGAMLEEWLADGNVIVEVVNSPAVNLGYGTDNNSVRFRIDGGLNIISIVPGSAILEATGTDTLDVSFDGSGLSSGTYSDTIYIISNDPTNSLVSIPVSITMIGEPIMSLSDTCILYDTVFQMSSHTRPLEIANVGCKDLEITNILFSSADISSDTSQLTIAAGDTAIVNVFLNPTVLGDFNETITIQYSGTDSVICVTAFVKSPPVFSFSPDTLRPYISSCNDTVTEAFTLYNTGQSDLVVIVGGTVSNELDSIMARLNNDYSQVTALIPGMYSFSDGITGTNIGDGGNDMYDGGNYLNTTLATNISYSNNLIVNSSAFGASGRYFTNKYPGLFVMAADIDNLASFYISGNLGADGSGSSDAVVLQTEQNGIQYQGFVKRVYNAGDPSVNHLIIVEKDPSIYQTYDTYTDNDDHHIEGLSGTTRLYYLLYASAGGGYVDNAATLAIMEKFISIVHLSSIEIIPPGDSVVVSYDFTSTGRISGEYQGGFVMETNDPLNPTDTIPYVFTFDGYPIIESHPDSIDFGTIMQFAAASGSFIVNNLGCDSLFVSDIISSNPDFTVDVSSFALYPGDSLEVNVTFYPQNAAVYFDSLTIVNNDAGQVVYLQGTALLPPIMTTSPDTIFYTATTCHELVSLPITVFNNGDNPLEFTSEAVSASSDVFFYDGFEQGNLDNWTIDPSMISSVSSTTSAVGSNSMSLTGSSGFYYGASKNFGVSNPSYISVYLNTGISSYCNYFVVGDDNIASNQGAIFLYYTGTNYRLYDGANEVLFASGLNQWHHFEFRNIDYVNHTLDYYVDGNLMATGFSFRATIDWFNQVHYFHYNYAVGYMDELYIGRESLFDVTSTNPVSGTVPVGSSAVVNVEVDLQGVITGQYIVNGIINGNDPLNPSDTIPCVITLNGYPEISLSENCLYWDSLMQYSSNQQFLTIRNSGCDTLKITDINLSSADFVVDTTSAVILAGDSVIVTVDYVPVLTGVINENLSIVSNAGIEQVCLQGYVFNPPQINVDPTTIDVVFNQCNDSITIPITISNTGDTTLIWNIPSNTGLSSVNTKELFSDDFDPDIDNTQWQLIENGYASNTCGSVSGSNALFFNGNGVRHLTTKSMDFSSGGEISFNLQISQGGGSCETADAGENVVLEYSTDGGSVWTTIQTYLNNAYPSFTFIQVSIPEAAKTSGTIMRIRQVSHSGSGYDVWELDDVMVRSYRDVLNFDISNGITLAGESSIVNATVNSEGLITGSYSGTIAVQSNDPLVPTVDIPCNITMNGYPVITFSDLCVNFDSVLQYSSSNRTIYIKNTGCDTLVISNISSGNADIQISPVQATLPAGDSVILTVTFNPLSSGDYSTQITVLNNDVDTSFCFNGYSLLPPVLAYSPENIDVSMSICNDTLLVPFTIYNNGDTNLEYVLDGSGSIVGSKDFLILNHSKTKTQFSSYAYDLVTESAFQSYTTDQLKDYKVVYFEPDHQNYSYVSSNMANLGSYIQDGGVLVLNIAGNIGSINNIDPLGTDYDRSVTHDAETFAMPAHDYITGTAFGGATLNASEFNYWYSTDHGTLLNYPVDAEVVLTNTNGASWIKYKYGRGYVIITTLTYGWTNNANPMSNLVKYSQYLAANSGDTWYELPGAPLSDTLVSGDSTVINIPFYSTGLVSGVYSSEMIIESNDPLRPVDTILCTLNFSGYPIPEMSDTCLYFDSILQYSSTLLPITINNSGCDTLFITDVTFSDSDFTISSNSGGIAPGDSIIFNITWSPMLDGDYQDTMTFITNAGNLDICLNGFAIMPPVIDVIPDTINVTIPSCNFPVTEQFTIYNNGSTNLQFTIDTADYYASFDGNNDYIVVPTNFPGLTYLTAETWFYPTSTSGVRWLISTGRDVSSPNGGFNLYFSGGNLVGKVFRAADNAVISVTAAGVVQLNQWHHVAMVYDGSQIILYVNGNQVATSAAYSFTGISDGSQSLHLGVLAYSVPNYYDYQGYMDEVRIWNVVRTPAQILYYKNRKVSPSASGLKGYWNFDAVNANDLTAFANNGTLAGNTSIVQNPDANSIFILSQTNATVLPGDSVQISVDFDMTGLYPGFYSDTISIESNDPVNPVVNVPVNIQYYGEPELALTDSCLVFDTILQYTSNVQTFSMNNNGCDTLWVYGVNPSIGEFVVDTSSFYILPGLSQTVSVAFNPISTGYYSEVLNLLTNDGDTTICLNGYAQSPPVLSYDPAEINVTINSCSDSVLVPFTIYNPGDTTLNWTINADGDAAAGKALIFNGSNSYVNLGAWAPGSAWTVEAWVNPSSLPAGRKGIAGGFSSYLDWGLTMNNGYLGMAFRDISGSTGYILMGEQPVTGKWYHLAAVCDGANATLYVNGVLIGTSQVSPGYLPSASGTQIGKEYCCSGSYFPGMIDEVRIWNSNLVQSDIVGYMNRTLSGDEDNLMGYWRFNEGSGTVVNDLSGNSHNGNTVGISWTNSTAPVYKTNVFDMYSGNTTAGDSTVINIWYYSDAFITGTYPMDFVISSNDPLNPVDTIPVNLTINGYPIIELSDSCLLFDTVISTTSLSKQLWISNSGCDTLFVTGFVSDDPAFVCTNPGFEILPNDSAMVSVTFNPVANIVYNATLTIQNNDIDTSLCLSGYGVNPPVIYTSADSLQGEITGCEDSLVTQLVIYNDVTAGYPLDFSIQNDSMWLSVSPGSGTVAIGDSVIVDVILDATSYSDGTFISSLIINSNDPSDSIVSVAVQFVKNPVPSAPGVMDYAVCFGDANPIMSASGLNINWYADASLLTLLQSGSDYTSAESLVGIYSYYITQTVDGCESPASQLDFAINNAPISPQVSDTAICFGEVIPGLIASGTNIMWYDDPALSNLVFSGNTLIHADPSAGVYTYYVTDSVGGCAASIADTVVLTIHSLPSSPVLNDTALCEGDVIPDLIAVGDSITWYLTEAPFIVYGNTLAVTDSTAGVYTYYASQTDIITGCESVVDSLVMSINPVPVAPVSNDKYACEGGIIPALTSTGTNVQWFTDFALTNNIFTGNTFNTGDSTAGIHTYYLTQTQLGCSSPLDSVRLTIYAVPEPPSVSDTSVCYGEPNPLIVATGTNVRWYNDSLLSTLLNTGVQYTPVVTDAGIYTFYLTQTSNSCQSEYSAMSYTIISSPDAPVLIDSVVTICEGSSAPPLVAQGYQVVWYDDLALTNIIQTGDTLYSPEIIAGEYVYYPVQTDSITGCHSTQLDSAIVNIYTVPGAPVVSDVNVCTNEIIYPLHADGNGINWYSDSLLQIWLFTGNDFDPGNTTPGAYTYYVTESISGCTSNYVSVTQTIYDAPSAPVVSDLTVCAGSNGTWEIIAIGTDILWYSDSLLLNLVYSGDTLIVSDAVPGVYTYYVTQGGGSAYCASSPSICVYTVSQPDIPVIENVIVCPGESVPDLVASNEFVRWYTDALLTNLVFEGDTFSTGNTLPGIYTYYAVSVDTALSCQSPSISVSLTITDLISAPLVNDIVVCEYETVPAFIATGTGLEWYAEPELNNLIQTGSVYNTGLTAPGTYYYYVIQTENGCRGEIATAALQINASPEVPVANNVSICFGDPTPELTAIGNGLHWYSDAGLTNEIATGNTYVSPETNVGIYDYYIVGTDSITGCSSMADYVELNINAIPGSPILTDSQVCSNIGQLSVHADGTIINWYEISNPDSVVFVGNDFMLDITGPGTVEYLATDIVSGCESEPDTMTIVSLDAPAEPFAEDVYICYTEPVPDLVASGTNINWYSDPALTNLLYSGGVFSTGQSGVGVYTYYVTDSNATTGCISLVNDVTLMISGDSSTPPVVSDANACYGQEAQISATGVNITWYSDSSLQDSVGFGATITIDGLAEGTHNYWAVQENGCGVSPADSGIITVNPIPEIPVTNDVSTCFSGTGIELTAIGTGLQWYSDSLLTNNIGSGVTISSPDTLPGLYTYYVIQSDLCTSPSADLSLEIIPLPDLPAVSDVMACEGLSFGMLTAAGTQVQWYDDVQLTNIVSTDNDFMFPVSIAGDYIYYVTQIQGICESNPVTAVYTVQNAPDTPIADDALICFGQAVPDLAATGTNVEWYADSSLSTLVNTGNVFSTGITDIGHYSFFVTQMDLTTGCVSPANEVLLYIDDASMLPVVSNDTACLGNDHLFEIEGVNIRWYADSLLSDLYYYGNSLQTDTLINGNYSFFVTQENGCGESEALQVELVVLGLPQAPVGFDTVVCYNVGPIDLFTAGSQITWYSDSLTTNILATGNTFTALETASGDYTYYVTEKDICESTPSEVYLHINEVPAAPVASDSVLCYTNGNVIIPAMGTGIIWYIDSLGSAQIGVGSDLSLYAPAPGNHVYYLDQLIGECRSAMASVEVQVLVPPAAPVGSDTMICYGTALGNLSVLGNNVTWYSDSLMTFQLTAGNDYAPGMLSVGDYYYYVISRDTITGCMSEQEVISVSVDSATIPPVTYSNSVCYGAGSYVSADGDHILWYDQDTIILVEGNEYYPGVLPVGVHTYYASDLTGCGESPLSPATITVNEIPVAPQPDDLMVCFGDVVPGFYYSGQNVIWYSNQYLTYQIGVGNSFNSSETEPGIYHYYLTNSDIVTGCTSAAGSVSLTINPSPLVTLNQYSVTIDYGESVQLIAYNAESYQWGPSTGLSSTLGQSVTATPLVTTSYTVTGTDIYGCSGTAVCNINVDGNSIEGVNGLAAVKVYPVPSMDRIVLEISSLQNRINQIKVFDITGREVFGEPIDPAVSELRKEYSFGWLSPGSYTITIVTDEGSINKRIIIKQ